MGAAEHGEYGEYEYEEESVAGENPDRSKTVSGGGASDDDVTVPPPTTPPAGAGRANGDARLRAAVAAWVASADDDADDEASDPPAGGDVSAAGTSGSSGASRDSGASNVPDAGEASDAADAAEEPKAGEPKKDTATAVFGTGPVRGKSSGASADAAGERPVDKATTAFKAPSWAHAEPEDEAGSEGGDTDGTDEGGRSSTADKGAKGTESTKADSGAPGPEAAADDEAPVIPKPSKGVKVAKAGKGDTSGDGDTPGDGDGGESASDKRPVDQATAVFKTVRPAPAVDQATTMLKLGGDKPGDSGKAAADSKAKGSKAATPDKPATSAPAAGDKPAGPGDGKTGKPADPADAKADRPDAKADKPGGKPRSAESDAERTSKFVALKSLDEPRPTPERKAPPQGAPKAPDAAGAGAAKAQDAPGSGTAKGAAAPQARAGAPAPEAAERTTQQPLPPKPPLDLLAELTNTPPPPETPVRTVVRRVKIWTPLVLLLVVVFAVVQAVRPLPEPKLTLTADDTFSFGGGKASIPWPSDGQAAMDVDGIGTFGTSGAQKPVPIASIAKVMTTYLILRDHPIKKGTEGRTLTVDAEAQRHYEKGKPENESVVKVTKGQKISQYEALQAVMLPSANNVARMLARWDSGGDEKAFVAKMNKTAKELGMKNTHYTDPSGLDKTTVSTAEDLVKLGRVAMENPTFKEIARQPEYKDLNGDTQDNYFGLVPTVAIGIKTGTTTAAGGNILFAAEKRVGGKSQVIIGAALAQFGSNGVANIDQVTKVVKDLISAGQDALTAKTVVRKGAVVGEVDDGLGGTTPVVATKDVKAVGWSGLTAKLELTDGGKDVPHTAKKGTRIGVLSVGDGTSRAVKVPVAVQKDLAEPSFGTKLTRVG
ncbi:D-alanyl-D-alanine carboxypeptidase [Streptomyces longispororuber]|uniref:D-alanyl-D-alanine carboxypeptidase n=1 Tax=Streptomyces longispororuber TaxID=68230 RepID=A0A919DU50_9ACTN|nr:D-alanyl-D-alanine carboxypeptidase [Streptomyces longispororuber]GHE77791.1 D-alanyl-D-alanine carboxypeptidase [Streptomyces longispororuber]